MPELSEVVSKRGQKLAAALRPRPPVGRAELIELRIAGLVEELEPTDPRALELDRALKRGLEEMTGEGATELEESTGNLGTAQRSRRRGARRGRLGED